MENYMELEKRPSTLKPSGEKLSGEHGSASLSPPALQLKVSQFESAPEEEELQMKKVSQMQEDPEEEELQMKKVSQLQGDPEEEEMQMKKSGQSVQRKEGAGSPGSLPPSLQNSAAEHLNSDFSDVRIHTNSTQASDLGALAYTQGTDIHFAPNAYDPQSSSGKSLIGHELTHVVQQSQGRVQPTGEIDGMPLNDDHSLEREADEMGNKFGR